MVSVGDIRREHYHAQGDASPRLAAVAAGHEGEPRAPQHEAGHVAIVRRRRGYRRAVAYLAVVVEKPTVVVVAAPEVVAVPEAVVLDEPAVVVVDGAVVVVVSVSTLI